MLAVNEGVVYVAPVPNKVPLAAALYQAVLPPLEEVSVVVLPQVTVVFPVITGAATFDVTVTVDVAKAERHCAAAAPGPTKLVIVAVNVPQQPS